MKYLKEYPIESEILLEIAKKSSMSCNLAVDNSNPQSPEIASRMRKLSIKIDVIILNDVITLLDEKDTVLFSALIANPNSINRAIEVTKEIVRKSLIAEYFRAIWESVFMFFLFPMVALLVAIVVWPIFVIMAYYNGIDWSIIKEIKNHIKRTIK